MRGFGVLLALAGCGAEPNVELTLVFGEVTPDMLAEGSAWGGLVSAPADNLRGTVRVVARERADDFGPGGVLEVEGAPKRNVGPARVPGSTLFWLEPGSRTLDVSDVALRHPGCAAGSEGQSGCWARGWVGMGVVDVPEAGMTSVMIEVWPVCECND